MRSELRPLALGLLLVLGCAESHARDADGGPSGTDAALDGYFVVFDAHIAPDAYVFDAGPWDSGPRDAGLLMECQHSELCVEQCEAFTDDLLPACFETVSWSELFISLCYGPCCAQLAGVTDECAACAVESIEVEVRTDGSCYLGSASQGVRTCDVCRERG